jgi:DNA invertase Pin-like site-specific DNA recombinase
MSKHVALYVRVSSARQDTASQEPDMKRWADSQDSPVVWYRDTFTGKTMDRPGFNKMVKAIEEGKVSGVVVWRLDRLGRTAKGLTALFEDFTARKVNLVSIKDGLDLTTPAGRLMANVLASVAAYETEVRAERSLAGQAVAKEKGVRFGRPEGPGKRIKVTPEQVAMIIKMKNDKAPVTTIAKTTGLSRPTIYSILEQAAS